MTHEPGRPLRILLADETPEHLERAARIVTQLGHTVVAEETRIDAVAAITENTTLDVAIIAIGDDPVHALALIDAIVAEASCPVIALLKVEDPAFVQEAAKRGVFAYLTNGDATGDRFEGAIEVVLHRFAEYHDLEGAFGRRALTERAKGILMERHSIDEEAAFALLRGQSRRTNRKLIDVAQAVLEAHALLPTTTNEPPPSPVVSAG